MSQRIDPRVLKGFRDFLPEAEGLRKQIQRTLEHTFELYGFVPIDTPVLEYTDILLGKGGGETEKQVYRFQDHGDRDVAMRFDLTVPLARYVAMHRHELVFPFKRYHIAKVWRGENTQKGRYREFTQCDFDIIGVDSPSSDFETLLLMKNSLEALGISNFTIHLSHRGIFNRLLEKCGHREHSVEILRTVDKLAKIGEEAVSAQLADICGAENGSLILDYIKKEDDFGSTLEKMTRLCGGSCPETERVARIHEFIKETGTGAVFLLDPSITRGLDYYTGLVFETFIGRAGSIGSVCSGGRYNNLASLYTKEEIPGIGSSIGLDRLIAALELTESLPEGGILPQVLVFCMDDGLTGHYHHLAQQLRHHDIRCEVYPLKKKLSQQFSFAENKKIPVGLLCGEEEFENNRVNIKNLVTRESSNNISMEEAVALIKRMVS